MRISDRSFALILSGALLSAMLCAPAFALEAKPAPPFPAVAPLPMFKDPRAALRSGAETLQRGDPANSIPALNFAADSGEALAQWKLGRMYATGEGVKKNDFTAYQYFAKIVREYNEDQANPRDVSIVSSAFVAIGVYSLDGIPNTAVKRDTARAQEMFHFAATTFGDPDAQYNLALMYIDGKGVAKNVRQSVRWLGYSAAKNHVESQAMLGNILFNGAEGIARQRARGLMYLTAARENAGKSERYEWVAKLYTKAMEQASETDREAARIEADKYVRRNGKEAQVLR